MSFEKEIDFYYTSTPNGWKIELALEEFGIPFKVHPIDIGKGDQFTPEFTKINPNGKIPAIVDPNEKNKDGEPLAVFESGAILIYLAQKTGKFLPDPKTDPAGNADVLQWLMWQMGGLGPMVGQLGHFVLYAPEKIPYGVERYRKEANRLLKVLDTQLSKHQFVSYTGDLAIFGWTALQVYKHDQLQTEVGENIIRWINDLKQRPSFAKWEPIYRERASSKKQYTEEEKKLLFGIEKK